MKNSSVKIALIAKECVGSYGTTSLQLASEFIARYLTDNFNKVEGAAFTAVDGNSIDQIVTASDPDVVIIEALWVTPAKLKELIDLHPRRRWIVRVHSKIEYLAQDGIAFEWLNDYDKRAVIAFNSKKTAESFDSYFQSTGNARRVVHLPNIYYPGIAEQPVKKVECTNTINVGVFGAARELKNNLNQIIAAINYANETGKVANIYVNTVGEDEIIKNITAISDRAKGNFKIVPISWLSHVEFLNLVRSLDLGLQVSFSESYNIVSFDFIYMGVPVITSNLMDCTTKGAKTQPDEQSIRQAVGKVLRWHCIRGRRNKNKLHRINRKNSQAWDMFICRLIRRHK